MLENHTQNMVEKLVPDPFFLKKKTKFSISADQQSRTLYSLFLLYVQVEGYGNILKLRCRQLAFTTCKAFLRKRSGANLHTSVFACLTKNISHILFY